MCVYTSRVTWGINQHQYDRLSVKSYEQHMTDVLRVDVRQELQVGAVHPVVPHVVCTLL